MDTVAIWQIVILLVLILGSAFFSSAETAFISVSRIQLQILEESGNKGASRVLWILDHNSQMLSAILIGNNIVNISASALSTTITIRLLGNGYIGFATGLLTIIVLVFGEIVPKSIAQTYALKLSIAYSGFIKLLMWVLTPLIVIIDFIRKVLLNRFGFDEDLKNDMTEDEVKGYVDAGFEKGAIEDDEFEMITNVFSLDTSLAKDIMIPRIDMVYIPLQATKEEFLEIYSENNYTRYPVFNENRDSVIGIVNVKDLLTYPEDKPFHIGNIMREPRFTFEHKEVGTLLIEMRKDAISLIIVLDEYGCTSGMITLEDILEEIVGEIRDEYDNDETDPVKELKEGCEYLVDGSTSLIDVNDELGTKFESEEYDSIGGYIIEYLDRLPKSGESMELEDGTKLIAEVVKRNRIEKVHIILANTKE